MSITEEEKAAIKQAIHRLVNQGCVEITGYRNGEPLYRITHKGIEHLKELRGKRYG